MQIMFNCCFRDTFHFTILLGLRFYLKTLHIVVCVCESVLNIKMIHHRRVIVYIYKYYLHY